MTDLEDLVTHFGPLESSWAKPERLDPDHAWPMLQRLLSGPEIDIVSVSGFVDGQGAVTALHSCRKLASWPGVLGTGTCFEVIEPPPFAKEAAKAVARIMGSGIFELEVLHDRTSGDHWTIDLNPRAFGQISLVIASGLDLPALWYEDATGASLRAARTPRRPPKRWIRGTQFSADLLVRLLVSSQRMECLGVARGCMTDGRVGPVRDWRDPLPAFRWVARALAHPRSLLAPTFESARAERSLARTSRRGPTVSGTRRRGPRRR